MRSGNRAGTCYDGQITRPQIDAPGSSGEPEKGAGQKKSRVSHIDGLHRYRRGKFVIASGNRAAHIHLRLPGVMKIQSGILRASIGAQFALFLTIVHNRASSKESILQERT
jgi:hypothetical protein